ncbi:MAG: hypothetical protein M1831_003695 [Alyxoria varia]|nr:MAG: hypothetical protein M1831_003695 [Alyxoria varia]
MSSVPLRHRRDTIHPNPKLGLLVVTHQDGELAVYDSKQLSLKLLVECEATTLAFSPDGSTLATGNASGVIQVFDFSGPAGDKITLLYQINANITVTQGLAFSQDNLYLLELRGSKCNVWEPQDLVRKSANDAEPEISSTIAQAPRVANVAGSQEAQITAVTLHTKNNAQSVATWTVEKPLLDVRIGEAIHQLLFNDSSDKLLVSFASADTIWSIVRGQAIASIKAHSHSPRRWINSPCNPEHLIRMADVAFHLHDWMMLKPISYVAKSSHHVTAISSRKIIKTALSCGRNREIIATHHWEPRKGYFGLTVQLWPAAEIAAARERKFNPLPASQQLSAVIVCFIGVFEDELLFISNDLWICATEFANGTGEGYWRYFFIPEDWLTDTGRLLCLVNGGVGHVIFAKEHQLAVIKGGLTDKDCVQF